MPKKKMFHSRLSLPFKHKYKDNFLTPSRSHYLFIHKGLQFHTLLLSSRRCKNNLLQTLFSPRYLEISQRQCQVQKKEKRENLVVCTAHLSRVFSCSSPGLRRFLGSSRTRPQSQRRKRSRAAPWGSLWTSPCPLSPSESHFAARCLQCPGCTWPPCSLWCLDLCNHSPLPSPLC